MSKYQKIFQEMVEKNKWLFQEFKKVHDAYVLRPKENQAEFNRLGQAVVEEIREWEKRLCDKTERGQFGVFSSRLSDKFWQEVRKLFPKIDFVGAKISD